MREPASPVLVVDTNPDGVEMYSTALDLAGIRSLTAASAREALGRIANERPSLMITGLRLRGDDARELIRRARRAAARPEIVIVGLSSSNDPATHAAAAECDLVLQVPCPPDRLVAEVRRALA